MANLETDKNLDKHLKPVKLGEANTSLELASEGNGAKIKGDLDVTGYTDNIKLRGEESIIKADGDITLDAAGTDIHFAVGGTSYLSWSAGGLLEMKAALDTSDSLSFNVSNTGISQIATVDNSGGNLANLELDVQGDIIFNPQNGVYIAQNANTEFSAANSAYAGMILGYTCLLNDAADTSYTVTNAFVTVDATTKVTFVGPPSGNVEIFVNVYADGATGSPLFLGLSDNATYNSIDVTHEHVVATVDETDEKEINHRWVITGLTPGTSYTYWLGAKCTHNSVYVLKWGGDATAEIAPFIMKAIALPATIYTG